ncbi:MAG TPA: tail fiber protein [Acidimicrobiia bacterium]
MARLFVDFIAGEVSNNPLTAAGTTLQGSFLADVPVVSGGNVLKLVLDPQGVNGDPEIIYVTSHSSGSTSATIQRGREGTAARQHPQGTRVVGSVTADDFDDFDSRIGSLETTVSDHTSDISGLQSTVSDHGSDISDLEGLVAALQGQVSDLEAGLGAAWPVGSIIMYGGDEAPNGWILCDGRAVSRTQYSNLFDKIGTRFGSGDGSTTFNVPNLQRRFPVGKASSGAASTVGSTGGTWDHTHSVPSHQHTVNPPATDTDVNTALDTVVEPEQGDSGRSGLLSRIDTNASSNSHRHYHSHSHQVDIAPFNSGSAGGGNTGSANPPYLVLNFIIKA